MRFMIQTKSEEEALSWFGRFPSPHGDEADGEIELRRLYELEDLGPSEAVDRFRELEARK